MSETKPDDETREPSRDEDGAKGPPEKPQDEIAPGPGADGAVPKVG